MPLMNLPAERFDETVRAHDLVVVDFWAPWCGPCLAFSPVFEKVSSLYPDDVFAKINIDEEPGLANDFNIRSVPLIMIFRREFAVLHHAGVQTQESLCELIENAKKIDIDALREKVKDN